MSVSRSARCLLRQSRVPSSLPVRVPQRFIHQTGRWRSPDTPSNPGKLQPTSQSSNKTPAAAASKSDGEIELTREAAAQTFPPYTEEEMEFLRRKYTPEQMAAIEAGESAIDPLDLLKQGVARSDSMKVNYIDDFRNIHPVLDKKRIAPQSNYDPKLRYKTDDEMDEDLAAFWEQAALKGDTGETEVDFERFMENYRYMVGKEEAERDPPDYRAPELHKLTDPLVKRTTPGEDEDVGSDDTEYWQKLSIKTGLSIQYIKRLRRKTLVTNFISNQTRMGKIHRILVVVVVGNEAGLLGIGIGKNADVGDGEMQAFANAVCNMVPIPRYEQRTIFGDVSAKVGATVVNLYNRPPGFGIRCQSKIFEMCKCAGISDLAAKVPRGRNPMNTIKAAFEALTNQRLPDDVAKGRGRKMVDVRKVYYAGLN